MKELLRGYDYTLIITPILLASFGIVMIYSASMVSTVVDGLDSTYYLFRQLQWFVLGLIGFIITCLFPYKKYQKMTFIIVIGSFILLARSEERRVGKAYRCRWWTSQQSKRGTS